MLEADALRKDKEPLLVLPLALKLLANGLPRSDRRTTSRLCWGVLFVEAEVPRPLPRRATAQSASTYLGASAPLYRPLRKWLLAEVHRQ